MLIDRLRGELLDHVVISAESAQSADPARAVASNREVVDYLSQRHLPYEEMSAQAVGSYFVDRYLRRVLDGGVGAFVRDSRWDGLIVSSVGRTLPLIGAIRHAEVFERLWDAVEEMGAGGLSGLLDSEEPEAAAAPESFAALTEEFRQAQAVEDLVELNAAFLTGHPRTELVPEDQLAGFLEALVAGGPGADGPGEGGPAQSAPQVPVTKTHFERAIDLFCEMRGMTLEAVTAGDPTFTYLGAPATAWHFLTDTGHFSVVDLGSTAVLFDDDDVEVATIDISHLVPVA